MWKYNFDRIESDNYLNDNDIQDSHRWNRLRHKKWIKRIKENERQTGISEL